MSAALAPEAQYHPYSLTRESWRTVWPEARELAAAHALEVGDMEWELDEKLLADACDSGFMHVFGARCEGKLIGYICWMVSKHPERKGKIMARMGPWFALPGSACGLPLFQFSVEELTDLGVQWLYPHHRQNARGGRRLGEYFQTLGATPMHTEYELKLGGK